MQVSFWERQSFYSHKHIIIAGAGLAGLWSALELHKRNNALQILLLDMGIIPAGASTRNAGFACFGSPTELLSDADRMGEDDMWRTVEMRYKGLKKIRQHFADDVIDYDDCGGYELLNSTHIAPGELDEKLLWLNKGIERITGTGSTFVKVNEKINQFNFNGFTSLVENKLEGGLHSGKLVQALTKKVLGLGIEIITSTAVAGWQRRNGVIEVNTDRGLNFTCDKLLICTNAFTDILIKNIGVKPARGQIIVTSPIAGLPFTGTFHFDEGYYYFRNLGDRVLLGGARNKCFEAEVTTTPGTTEMVQMELERFLRENILAGQEYTIEHRWSGVMGFTGTKQPIAEQVEPGIYAIIACNGMGVALTPFMAEKAARLVLQE